MAGRPRKLNAKLESEILELISDGKTLRETFSEIEGYTWQSFRKELLLSDSLMTKYVKSKELAVDVKLSELEDKRKELEAKIESGDIDGKAGQNLTNIYKILVANTQWSASKLSAKRYSKQAELTIKGDSASPLVISWDSKD
tara:strand:+ start:484 stop:909 length:426 start_codon:yes stop_codon:yes gene_type:complete